jgi:hypothetical protein
MLAASVGLCAVLVLGSADMAAAQSTVTPGLVFNLASDFRGIESYQGGVGVKVLFGKSAVRTRISASYAGASGAVSLGLGLAYEYHFASGMISPYAGVSADGGWLWDGQGTTAVPVTIGAIIGVEIFPVDFLSFFVEYTGTVGVTFMTTAPGAAPALFTVGALSMGNQSRVGVVVYFSRLGGT